jgi:hypothetical protein
MHKNNERLRRGTPARFEPQKPTVLTINGLPRDLLVRSLDGREAIGSVLPSSQGLR